SGSMCSVRSPSSAQCSSWSSPYGSPSVRRSPRWNRGAPRSSASVCDEGHLCQARRMQVHLVDGTYELFRQFLAPRPGHRDKTGVEVRAPRAGVSSSVTMLEGGVTHVGVATDHVIPSFRNDLWVDYKTGEGIDP